MQDCCTRWRTPGKAKPGQEGTWQHLVDTRTTLHARRALSSAAALWLRHLPSCATGASTRAIDQPAHPPTRLRVGRWPLLSAVLVVLCGEGEGRFDAVLHVDLCGVGWSIGGLASWRPGGRQAADSGRKVQRRRRRNRNRRPMMDSAAQRNAKDVNDASGEQKNLVR